MKATAILTALLTAAATVTVCGQQYRIIPKEQLDSVANPVAAADSPMRFERTRIDTGTIGEDDAPSQYTFRWHNDSNEPVVITEVRTSCGCAVANYEKRPVPAGEEGEITVTYHPKGHPGLFVRKISVFTQNGGVPAAVLELSGDVTPSVRPTYQYPHVIGPLRLKQMRVRMEGTRRSVESIEVMNAGETPLTITADSRMLPEYIKVTCLPASIEPGGKADIDIAFDPAKVKTALPKQVPVILEGIALPPGKRTIYIRFGEDADE